MQLLKSDIFDSDCDVIVNPVNVVGVMGAGLALKFKNKYPEMFRVYKHLCDHELLLIGCPAILSKTELLDRNIVLFPTKIHWKNESKLVYIKDGLDYLARIIDKDEFKSIGFPLLGCGLGGLNKEVVLPLIEKFELDTGIKCKVYEV